METFALVALLIGAALFVGRKMLRDARGVRRDCGCGSCAKREGRRAR